MSEKTSKGEDGILDKATLLQCLKGLSSQKDGTRIRMTIDLWYDHGQDPAMLTFNQGAMREHLRLYLQAKSSRRLKIVLTAELKILLPSSLHTSSPCLPRTSPHIPVSFPTLVFIFPITINTSPHATLLTVSWSLKKKLILAHYYLRWAHIPAFIPIHFVYTVSFLFLPNIGLTVLLLLPNSSTLPLLNYSNWR